MTAHQTSRPARRSSLSLLRHSLRASGGRTAHRSRARAWRELSGLIVVAGVVLVVSVSVFIRVRRQSARPPELSPVAVALPPTSDIKWDEKWPSLVISGLPARPLEEIRATYAFAARRPDVLRSMPCYCGCKRQGHESNEACYVRSRSTAGVPRWTDHAITCGMCIDITHDAIVMTTDHESVDAIRRAIETKYQGR